MYVVKNITHTQQPLSNNYSILKITAIWQDTLYPREIFRCTLYIHIKDSKPLFWQWEYSNNPKPPRYVKQQVAEYVKRKFNINIKV